MRLLDPKSEVMAPPRGSVETSRVPIKVEARVVLDLRRFESSVGIVEPGVLLVGRKIGNYIVDDPGEGVELSCTPPHVQGFKGLEIELALIWWGGAFNHLRGEFLSHFNGFRLPHAGGWCDILADSRGSIQHLKVGGGALWLIITDETAWEWSLIVEAFGTEPDALGAIRKSADCFIRNMINDQGVRAANSSLIKLAASGVLQGFTSEDIGPLGLEVFHEALREGIDGVDLEALPGLVADLIEALALTVEA